MSEAVSALSGASFDGLVRVEDAGLRGMIALRGDLGSSALASVAGEVSGLDLPARRGAITKGDRGLLWMSPDELLVMVPYAEAADAVARISAALKGEHHLAADVSDARCLFRLTGGPVREVLAKLTPADLHPASLAPGELRRTRLGQVAAAFWIEDDGTAWLICFRSMADYVFRLLTNAAQPAADVGHF